MGRAENKIVAERIAEAVAAAEDKYFHQGNTIGDITDITKFGAYLLIESKVFGKVMVNSGVWRSNYPAILEEIAIGLIRKRLDFYREGILNRDVVDDN